MAKGRDISAEHLSDVLELIRKRRQSGMLSVEHFQGAKLEEGELYFHNGQIIYAKTGPISGQEAFKAFVQWRQVLFSFQANARPPQAVNTSPNLSLSKTVMPELDSLIPQRIDTVPNVLSLPLTRPQRSIYLLVDGQRSIADLARCTRKSIQEIELLLRELQQQGLVSL
jgi:hypothetical protein